MTGSMNGCILVTGGTGQVATSLAKFGGERVMVVGRPEFDFDRPETIALVISKYKPAYVINAAAWTAVDLAESHIDAAIRANETGPLKLAQACAHSNTPLIHLSTDYVYDGEKGLPYLETDPVTPCTVYGRTKAAGEQAVLAINPRSLILRTAWVYSAHGKNFVRTILNAAVKNSSLKVVADQLGNPTSSDDLAQAILVIISRLQQGWHDHYAGIYHATGRGQTTWHGLAVKVLEEAGNFGYPMPEILPITTQEWPTPARRPPDSRLENRKLQQIFKVKLPRWETSVALVTGKILATGSGAVPSEFYRTK